MVLNKEIKVKIVNLRLQQYNSWENIAIIICKENKWKFSKKQFARIKKAGQREIKYQQVDDGMFIVEEILDRKTSKADYQYHIKWVGSDEITWEERSNLLLTEAMQVAINEYDDYHS